MKDRKGQHRPEEKHAVPPPRVATGTESGELESIRVFLAGREPAEVVQSLESMASSLDRIAAALQKLASAVDGPYAERPAMMRIVGRKL